MAWEETTEFYGSNHRDVGVDCRTIFIDEQMGIKANYCENEETGNSYIQSYLFLKSSGWNMETAESWFNEYWNIINETRMPLHKPGQDKSSGYQKGGGRRLYCLSANPNHQELCNEHGIQAKERDRGIVPLLRTFQVPSYNEPPR